MTAYAFQCMDCGHLVEGPAAGERRVPLNCPHCDIGSHLEWYSPDGFPAEQGQVFPVTRDIPAIQRPHPRDPDTTAWFDPDGFPAKKGDMFTVTDQVAAIPRQVVDRPNEFIVLADLTAKQQDEILKRQANPDDTIERYVPALKPVNGGKE